MKAGLIYRLQIDDMESTVRTTVDIFDNSVQIDDSLDPEIVELNPAEPASVFISVINNERDKFTPIRAKQATIQFLSDSNNALDFTTFINQSDNNWPVLIYTNTPTTIFNGFLMLSDMFQPFLPDPQVVTLIASDHLGTLNDIPFTLDNLVNPKGKFKLSEVIALCLKKTGMSLDIKVINNLRHGSGELTNAATFSASGQYFVTDGLETGFFYPGQLITISGTPTNDRDTRVTEVIQNVITEVHISDTITTGESAPGAVFQDRTSLSHFYDIIWIDALTFEDQIGTCKSCREVLEILLGEDCYLTQWKGDWYIMRVDEFEGNPIYIGNFDSDGTFLSMDAGTAIDKSIGAGQTHFFANAQQQIEANRPHKVVKLIGEFDTPQEIPPNVDFDRGTGSDPVGLGEETIDYELSDWTYLAEGPVTIDKQQQPGSTGVLRKLFIDGYEDEKYLYTQTAGAFRHYFRSEAIPVKARDRISVSVDVLASPQTNYFPVHVRLVADNGDVYDWDYDDATGVNAWNLNANPNATGTWFADSWRMQNSDGVNWNGITGDSKDIPENGRIYIRLVNGFTSSEFVQFQNFSFEYKPFINGNYLKYESQYNQVTRNPATDYNAKRENTVRLIDSVKPLFKGSMFYIYNEEEILKCGGDFAPTNSIVLSFGDFRGVIAVGMIIRIEDSVSNDGEYRVEAIQYNIIGDTTVLTVSGDSIVFETGAGLTIYNKLFNLSQRFYASAPFALGSPPDWTYTHQYGYIQVFSVWNQYRNAYRIFTGAIKNLGLTWPDLLHKYTLTDSNPNTNNRYFMLLSYEQDWRTGIMSGVWVEVYRTDIGKVYDDDFEFKYLT